MDGALISHLGIMWCAAQVPELQKGTKAAIIDMVKGFLNKVSDLLLVHATDFLHLPPKAALIDLGCNGRRAYC